MIKNNVILAAFEIATTISTANKAINDRYRNLFAIFPTWTIKAALAVKSSDYEAARAQLFTIANEKQRLSQKVRIFKVSELTNTHIKAFLEEITGAESY